MEKIFVDTSAFYSLVNKGECERTGVKDFNDFDYIDATSFIFMKRMSISKALSLDLHYSQMNFTILPRRKKIL